MKAETGTLSLTTGDQTLSLSVSELRFTDTDIVQLATEPKLELRFASSQELLLRITQPMYLAPIPTTPVNVDVSLRPFNLEIVKVEDMGTRIDITTRTKSVDPHVHFDTLHFHLAISPNLVGRTRARKIREHLLWVLTHELNECLRYADGEAIVEPHPEQHGNPGPFGGHPDLDRMVQEAEER